MARAFREKRSPEFASRRAADMPDFYPWWTTPPFRDVSMDEGPDDG